MTEKVTATKLQALLQDEDTDEIVIDVRTRGEYRGGHIEGAENVPLNEVEAAVGRLKEYGHVYVTCGTGARSREACKKLAERGVAVVDVEGGLGAWQREGFETEGSGKGTIPIIRQVMIVAGVLILLGAGLGAWVHPYFFGLSAFVGAGLLFAGVSGICTMSMVLAKMPWNR